MEEKTYSSGKRVDIIGVILVFLIILVLLITAGYILSFGQSSPTVNPTVIKKTAKNLIRGPKNIPKDWKIFKDETLKLSFYYPPSWTLDDKKPCCSFTIDKTINGTEGHTAFQITKEANINNLPLELWIKSSNTLKNVQIDFTEPEKRSFGDVTEAETLDYRSNKGKGEPAQVTLLRIENFVYVLSWAKNENLDEQERQNLKTIFRSFDYLP